MLDLPDPSPLPTHAVEEPVAGLIARLAAGWSPLPYVPHAVESVTYNGEDLTDRFLDLRVAYGVLRLRFRSTLSVGRDLMMEGSLQIETRDGAIIEAVIGGTGFQFGGVSVGEGMSAGELILTSRRWTALPTSARAVLWVGRLTGASLPRGDGNLETEQSSAGGIRQSSGHFVLSSTSATVYLVSPDTGGESSAWFAVEPRGDFDSNEVWRDRMLLRTLFGSAFDVGSFVALDADGKTVGSQISASSIGGREVSGTVGPLVPLGPSTRWPGLTWTAPFFSKLVRAYSLGAAPGPVTTAIFRYGHSLAPMDADTEFVMVAGAVRLLLRGLLDGDNGEHLDVSLVTEGLNAAESAIQRGDQGALREALVEITSYLDGDREREYLIGLDNDAGVVVYNELVASRAVWDRGTIRPVGTAGTRETDIEGFQRVQRLRRAFAVLLAHAIGYGGPVGRFHSYIGEGYGWLQDPDVAPEDRETASSQYTATTETEVSAVWPAFRLPSVPDVATVRAFVAFADGLREQTQGAVLARLRPLPQRGDGPADLSFRLVVAVAPTVHVALFTVRVTDDGVAVLGWDDEARVLTTPDHVAAFGQEVAQSDELQYQVERLLLIGDDVQRGESAAQV